INGAVSIDLLPDSIEENIVTGTLRTNISLTTQGDDVEGILSNLNGEIFATLTDGSLDSTVVEILGFDVAETAVSFLADNPNTRLDCLAADLPIKNGVINGDQVIVATVDSRIYGQGEIDLSKQEVDYTLRTIAQDPSPLSFPTPIRIQGTFSKPRFSVEARPLLKELATSVFQPAEAFVEWLQDEDDQEQGQASKGCQGLLAH